MLGHGAGFRHLHCRPWLVMDQRVHRRAQLRGQGPHDRSGPAAAQDQLAAALGNAAAQTLEAVMQPPALRRAHLPGGRRLIIQYEQRHDRPAFGSGDQGGVIGEAQIVAEPDKLGGHGHGLSTIRRASR